MPAAAALLARHPDVPVCIDHMGKLWRLDGSAADGAKVEGWRGAMKGLAALPQVYCKLSMLGNAVPGWPTDPAKEAQLRGLVLEVIELFGAKRCMFNSNWHINGSISNSDRPLPSDEGLTMERCFVAFSSWVEHLSEDEREWLFVRSAETFYRI
mmetsp:Transcript_10226/g.27247  ORF Transcript_10226/g.27247 Transcript_10226/m.27247 type:complete len:154 (+) Transcript_10226:585-1046(+)